MLRLFLLEFLPERYKSLIKTTPQNTQYGCIQIACTTATFNPCPCNHGHRSYSYTTPSSLLEDFTLILAHNLFIIISLQVHIPDTKPPCKSRSCIFFIQTLQDNHTPRSHLMANKTFLPVRKL